MSYKNIINSRFSEPAAIISDKDGAIKLLAVNDNFLPELWMDITKDDFIKEDFNKGFDEDALRLFTEAVKKCVDSGKEQTVEIWRQTFSDCCGYEKICIRSRLIPVEKTDEGTIIYGPYESNKKQMYEVELANGDLISIDDKHMRPQQ